MEEEGIVKRIDGNIAKVAFTKKGGCGGGCSSCKSGCPKDTIMVDLENTKAAIAGDRVLVSMDNAVFKNMTFWAYAFPTIITVITLMVTLYVFGKFNLNNYELYSAFSAIVAMLISYKISAKINKGEDKYTFKMIRKIK
ncbi:MAG: SoxR reducing system RseC family protein [Clostridium sp.]|uniref:SoxR reducing system RseC family protein n=1 Tax=Clostridium sp. TaxID=1506 RepID=UPI0030243116